MASIEHRGDSYRIMASAGYGADGRQIRKRMTWTPPQGLTTRQTEKELNRIAVEFESQVQNGEYVDESKMRLAEYCLQYMDITKDKLSPTSRVYYQRIIDEYITPSLGHMQLQDLKPLHVQKFVNALSNNSLCKTTKKIKLTDGSTKDEVIYKNFAPSSVRRYYVVLQSILHSASKLGLIKSNPADSEKIDLPMLEPPKTDIFTKQEAALMLECLEHEPTMFQALIKLAITTGARRGELVALKWSDIDFDNLSVSISKSNYKIKGQETASKMPKTTGSIRVISVPPFVIDLLKEYRKEQLLERFKLGDRWYDEGWIFTQWNGLPMNPTTPTTAFSKFLKKNSLPHRKFHALRHTSATLLLSSGANIKTVASRLGHTQLATTNRYIHMVSEADV